MRNSTHNRVPVWERGYTLVTLLVVVTIIAASFAVTMPAFQNWIQRIRVEGYGRNIAGLMHLARSRAILHGVQTVVHLDEDEGEIYAFLDRTEDGIFNPAAGASPGTTDQKLATHSLPGGVGFIVPKSENLVDGFTPVAGMRVAIFTGEGAVRNPGALRFGDNWGNHLEVRVGPTASARVAIRKYRKTTGGGGDRWLSRSEGPWEWYWGKGRKGGGGGNGGGN